MVRYFRQPNRPRGQVVRGQNAVHAPTQLPTALRLDGRRIEITLPPWLLPPCGSLRFFNPSLLAHRNRLRISIRAFYFPNSSPPIFPSSRIVLGTLDDSLQMVLPRIVRNIDDRFGPLGAEDARLFELPSGQLGAIATTGGSPDFALSAIVFDDADDVADVWTVAVRRKNMVPIVDKTVRLLFSPRGPVIALNLSDRRASPDPNTLLWSDSMMRGSAQVVPHPSEDGYLSVAHELHRSGASYTHRWVRYSPELQVTAISKPWILNAPGIEYVAGLAWWHGKWLVSYGIADRECHLISVEPETVDRMLAQGKKVL
jgi:hypothetical protein